MSSTLYSAEFRAGIANLIKNMVDDALTRYPVKCKDITLSSKAIEGTCQFLTNCIISAGVSHHRVRVQVDASRSNPNGETTVFEASISLDGKVLYRFTGEMFNVLAWAAVAPSNSTPAKMDPVSAEAATLADGLRTALKSLLGQYPQPSTPFAITEEEVKVFVDFAGPFFDVSGFTTQHACQTGPDTGRGTFVLTMFTLAIYQGRGKVYEMDISPEYVRAFLAAQVIVKAESYHLNKTPFERTMVNVEVKVLDEELYWGKNIAPRGSEDSAGIDLQAAVTEDTFLEPGETKLIPTGLAFYLANPNFVGLIHPRSGLGHKHGIVLGNLTGVIDADYNGQLMVSLWNRNAEGEPYKISRGDRIAQYLIQPVVMGLFKQVNEFSTETERGAGGFGHSGAGQEVTRGTLITDGKSVHVHSHQPLVTSLVDHHSNVKKMPVQLGELPDAVKDKTFGERMNETRPRVFKKEPPVTDAEKPVDMAIILDNLQAVINQHKGKEGYVATGGPYVTMDKIQPVLGWVREFVEGQGGDFTTLDICVCPVWRCNHVTSSFEVTGTSISIVAAGGGANAAHATLLETDIRYALKNYVKV